MTETTKTALVSDCHKCGAHHFTQTAKRCPNCHAERREVAADSKLRTWHVLEREVSGSIVLYYTKDGDQTHYVVWDSLDRDADQEVYAAQLAAVTAERDALAGALRFALAYSDVSGEPDGEWQTYARGRWGETWHPHDIVKALDEARAALREPEAGKAAT